MESVRGHKPIPLFPSIRRAYSYDGYVRCLEHEELMVAGNRFKFLVIKKMELFYYQRSSYRNFVMKINKC